MVENEKKLLLSREDARFLADLQAEMDTQPTLATADPRFWVVTQDEFIPCAEDEDADEVFWYDADGETIYHTQSRDITPYAKAVIDSFVYRYECREVGMKRVRRIVPNTLFFTLRECEEHIRDNDYHYRNPEPYCMCAWRSPQVERLWRILRATDWVALDGCGEEAAE